MNELQKMLDVSRAPKVAGKEMGESLRRAEFTQDSGTIEVAESAAEGDAADFLTASGQNLDDWEVTGFRRIEYGRPEDPSISTRFTYKRRVGSDAPQVDIDELLELFDNHQPLYRLELGPAPAPLPGAAVLIGDNQFGKGISDPYEAIAHARDAIDSIAEALAEKGGAKELLVAFLGDHVEGFVSQGGANVWRTKLTLSEQIRATRRMMAYALERLHPLTDRLVMAAIPGNHGEAQRFNGKGVTTYDDNHDVEALNAIAEAAQMSRDYQGVEFYVPQVDELSLVVEVGGVRWGLVHGDRWRAGKHFDWWAKQTFGGKPLAGADVLVCGHWHHLLIEEAGEKLFIQTPALETESAWFEHAAGTRGNPGAVLVLTDNVRPVDFKVIRVREKAVSQ